MRYAIVLVALLIPTGPFELIDNPGFEDEGIGWDSWGDVNFMWDHTTGWYVALGGCTECYEGIGQEIDACGRDVVATFTYEFRTDEPPTEQHQGDYLNCFLSTYDPDFRKLAQPVLHWSYQGNTGGFVTAIMEVKALPYTPVFVTCVMDTNEDAYRSTALIKYISVQAGKECHRLYLPVVRR